jgi:hypothetical protein
VVKMVQGKGGCQGRFLGLVIDGEDKRGGLYSAIQSGECEVVEYIEHSNVPNVLEFEEKIAKAFIEGMNSYELIHSCNKKSMIDRDDLACFNKTKEGYGW